MREVVVTGIGLVTPLGVGQNVNWERLIKGYSGIKKIDTFETDDLPCKIAGLIPFVFINDVLLKSDNALSKAAEFTS